MGEIAGPNRCAAVPDTEIDTNFDFIAFQMGCHGRFVIIFDRQTIVRDLGFAKADGKPVAIRRLEHVIPDFVEFVEEDILLSDPDSYRVMLDRPIVPNASARPQELPYATPETIPPPQAERVNQASDEAGDSDDDEDEAAP